MYKEKEIVLVPCPYTDDISVEKQRPLLVISKEKHNKEEKCLFGLVVTSNPSLTQKKSDYLIEIEDKDIKKSKLKYQSYLVANMPYATYVSQVRGRFGTVENSFFNSALKKFLKCFK